MSEESAVASRHAAVGEKGWTARGRARGMRMRGVWRLRDRRRRRAVAAVHTFWVTDSRSSLLRSERTSSGRQAGFRGVHLECSSRRTSGSRQAAEHVEASGRRSSDVRAEGIVSKETHRRFSSCRVSSFRRGDELVKQIEGFSS